MGPSAVCSAVSSAGEAPTGAVQPPSEGAVRENGALFFDPMRTAAVRYLAFNPGRARRAARTTSWGASRRIARFDDFLEVTFETKCLIGRPMGSPEFLEKAEAILGRTVQPKRPGGKPKAVEQNRQMILWRRNSLLIGAADEQQFSVFIGS